MSEPIKARNGYPCAVDRARVARTLVPIARAARLVASLLVASGCVARAAYFDIGVELAPDAEGWRDDLRIEPHPTPVEFRWQDGQMVVAIANWPHDPTYFMVYVNNDADEAARMLVHGVSPGWAAHGRYDAFARREYVGGGKLIEGGWIDLPAHGMVQFWIDDLPWLGDPSAGDRIDGSVDIERGGAIVTCPLRFHVARVFRKH